MKEKIRNKKGFIQIPLLIGIIISIVVATGVGYGAFEYHKTSKIIGEAERLAQEEKYDEAIEKLELAQNRWLTKTLGIKKQKITGKIEKNKKDLEDKLKLTQALEKFDEENWQESINSFSGIPEDSFYYKDAQLKTEEAKRKIVEEELGETKIAKKEAEEKAQQETIKRSQAEARAKQEEFERKLKEQQLSEKEAEEKRMNADNDGDGLTYRRELELGTSDWDTDSDSDGIKDGEDAHPNGGGRYLAQNFEWEHKGTIWTWNYSVQEDWYEYYKNKPRSPQGTEYVTPDDPFIKEIAKALKEAADEKNYHLSSFIVSFIQGLPYVEDYYTTFDEYPKYPIETFVERNGDCEDTSYLFASLVQATGIGTTLVEFHNHMGVGVKMVHSQSGYYYPIGDEWYYYYETTGEGWNVGELPSDYSYEEAKITRIRDSSINYLYPKYIKPCYSSSDFPGYYSDGENFYSDSQCNYLAYCLRYDKFYIKPKELNFYWDSSCSQIVVKGCYKSTDYLGYFYDSFDFYYDSQCTQKAKICRASTIYSNKYYDGDYNYWDSNCTQKVLSWCDISYYYTGYFFNYNDGGIYIDNQCTQKADIY